MRMHLDSFANRIFGNLALKYEKSFIWLKDDLKKANMPVLLRTYLARSFLIAFITYIAVFLLALTTLFLKFNLFIKFSVLLIAPLLISIISFFLALRYPKEVALNRAKNIYSNLPFAINHMSAIAISGAPSSALFEAIKNFEEYGEIAHEAGKIVKRVKVFGQDIRTAIKEVAKHSPSNDLRDLLYAILSTMEKGGNLKSLLDEKAKSSLFDYKMSIRRTIQNISTFATIYTAMIFAGPLLLALIFAILALIGGDLFGISFNDLFGIMPFIIISLNIFFMLSLNLFQSGVEW